MLLTRPIQLLTYWVVTLWLLLPGVLHSFVVPGSPALFPPTEEVVSLTLIDANSDNDIGILNDGDTIDLYSLGSDLNIRANTSPSTVGSVEFDLNFITGFSLESAAPYSLAGDKNGDYYSWTPNLGFNTITATPYSGSGGGGSAGIALIINFYVVNNAPTDCNGVAGGSASIDDCGICSGGNTGLVPNADKDNCGVCFGDNSSCPDCNGDIGGGATLDQCGVCSGGLTGITPNSSRDSCGICLGDGSSCAGCTTLEVVSFTLIDADNGQELGFLNDGDTIDQSTIGNFSIRANVCNYDSVESVVFTLDSAIYTIDNGSPFAINGNQGGQYNPWNAFPGQHLIGAIPYSANNGSGIQGLAKSINVTLIDTGEVDTSDPGSLPNLICGNFPGGRIALTFDGNLHDSDDYVALPMAMAMLQAAGIGNNVVHIQYNTHLGITDSIAELEMNHSAYGGALRFGYPSSILFDGIKYPDSASDALAAAVNASSQNSPLWILAGGPMEVVWRGLDKADSVKRQYVRVVSHSEWNENHTHFGPPLYNDWPDLLNDFADDSVQFIQIPDQNIGFKSPKSFWLWLVSSPDTNWHWLWGRNKTSSFDVSDAGMAYWLASGGTEGGDTNGQEPDAKALLESPCDLSCSCACDTNIKPLVSITDPVDSAVYLDGDDILLQADINDPDSNTVRVDFYHDTTLIGSANTEPYEYNWPSRPAGSYKVSATCVDSCGEESQSDTLLLAVVSVDCNGDTSGTAFFDNCGICSGGNTGNIPNANLDTCGVCFGNNLSCVPPDCNGDSAGTAFIDSCNVCAGGNTGVIPNSTCLDCNGEINGTAFIDSCGECAGGNTGIVPNSTCNLDCNGDTNGTAYFDSCGVCAGGNTGVTPNSTCLDCNGDINGTAFTDSCGVCSGGNTGIAPNSSCLDCNGDINGAATVDNCNVCSGGNTGIAPNSTCLDCNGDVNGTASVDSCNVCSGGNTGITPNTTCLDCNGDLNGTASIDSCGQCSGGNTGVIPNASCTDCFGVINGTAFVDSCGECSGGNTGVNPNESCTDCNGVVNGAAFIDTCNVCAGGNTGIVPNTSCPGCVPNEVASLTLMQAGSGGPIRKLVDGDIIIKSVDGPFSIRADACEDQAVESVVFNLNGSDIQTESVPPYAINGDNSGNFNQWDPSPGIYTLIATPYSANGGKGTAGVPEIINFTVYNNPPPSDCNGDPAGTAFIDNCGDCVGGNTGQIPDAGCTDCNGDVNGTAFVDSCGVCAGGLTGNTPNASCTDCDGIVNGSAAVDSCGVCSGGNTGISPNSTCLDCNGVINGTASIDFCGECSGGNTGVPPNSTCNIDCNGDINGLALIDSCGECAGGNTGIIPNSGCLDCNGDINGTAFVDSCGDCTAGNTGLTPNANCTDCNNDINGTAFIDTCGVCAGGNTGVVPNQSCGGCVQLEVVGFTLMSAAFNGGPIRPLVNGGVIIKSIDGPFSVRADVCDQPVGSVVFNLNGNDIQTENVAPYSINGDNSNGFKSWDPAPGIYTLTGKPYSSNSGNGTLGVTETITFTVMNDPPPTDCNGDTNGTASVDLCGVCSGGNTGIPPNATCNIDCNGDVNGTAAIDSCGECSGGNTGVPPNSTCLDCNGDINGTAAIDLCGDCSGGNTGLVPNSSCLDCNGDPNGFASIDQCGDCTGGNTGISPNAGCTDCNGDINGTAFIDTCGECAGGNTGIIPNTSCIACVANEVTALVLVDAVLESDVGELMPGDTIDRSVLPQFSIRADVCSTNVVESVRFYLNGSFIQNENVAPYAINGDSGGDYKTWDPGNGNHTVEAIPYTGNSGGGTSGVSEIVNFWVVDGAQVSAGSGMQGTTISSSAERGGGSSGENSTGESLSDAVSQSIQDVRVYPNPTTGELFIEISGNIKPVELTIHNATGKTIFNNEKVIGKTVIDLSTYSDGMYWIVIHYNGQTLTRKVVKE